MTKGRKMKIKNNYVLQTVTDEYIVVPIADEADRLHGVIKLNETGAFLWNYIEKQNYSMENMVEAIIHKYGVERSIARNDVSTFIAQLKSIGCLED